MVGEGEQALRHLPLYVADPGSTASTLWFPEHHKEQILKKELGVGQESLGMTQAPVLHKTKYFSMIGGGGECLAKSTNSRLGNRES